MIPVECPGERGLFLIAAREPRPGQTKTRLGAAIGMDRAAALYAAFLVDLAARFTPCPDAEWEFDLGWAYTPADVDFRPVLTEIGCDDRRRRSASSRNRARAGTCGRRTCCAGATSTATGGRC